MTATGQFSLLRSLNFRVALLCILHDWSIIATLRYIYMYIGAGGSVPQTGQSTHVLHGPDEYVHLPGTAEGDPYCEHGTLLD